MEGRLTQSKTIEKKYWEGRLTPSQKIEEKKINWGEDLIPQKIEEKKIIWEGAISLGGILWGGKP